MLHELDLDAIAAARVRIARHVVRTPGTAALAAALREGRGRCGVLLSRGNADPAHFAEAARRAATLRADPDAPGGPPTRGLS